MSDKNIARVGWVGGINFGGVQGCAELMKKIDIQMESGNTGLLFVLGNMLFIQQQTSLDAGMRILGLGSDIHGNKKVAKFRSM